MKLAPAHTLEQFRKAGEMSPSPAMSATTSVTQ